MLSSRNNLLILILSFGAFGILNTEIGVVGILPLLADYYHISVAKAGQLVSLFALMVAISGPVMPILLSGINRKMIMLLSLGVFVVGNIVPLLFSDFNVILGARMISAIFHPVYVSTALTLAASSGDEEESRKSISKIMLGVSAGMVLGTPLVSFIANSTTIQISLAFFAVINTIAFVATIFFVPSLPVQEKVTYGKQLRVLTRPITWLSLGAVISIMSALAATNSFLAEYMEKVTRLSGQGVTAMLLVFGLASILGNVLAGKLLSQHSLAMKTAIIFPMGMIVFYLVWFFTGAFLVPLIVIMFMFGMLFSIGNNINQYWMSSAAPEAPDFANGLYLSGANWGVSIGTAIGGLLITGQGIESIIWGGMIFFILSMVFILLRKSFNHSLKPISK